MKLGSGRSDDALLFFFKVDGERSKHFMFKRLASLVAFSLAASLQNAEPLSAIALSVPVLTRFNTPAWTSFGLEN